MTGVIDWAAKRARMILAFIGLSIAVGAFAYASLPKEGEPDIEIPALFVSVPFPGISAEDSEKLLVKPMETELSDLDGLKKMSATAAEGYAGVAMEFEFGWDKTKILADVRDAMNSAEAAFPDGAEQYSINEINFSEFPIIIVNLSGPVPERTLLRVAADLQDRLEGLEPVLEAPLAGHRDEMVEVVIDPLRLEAYNVTANELIECGPQQQPADRRRRDRDGDRRVQRQDPVVVRRACRHLHAADQGQRRPGGDAGRPRRYPPDVRGPHGHGPLQRRKHGRASGGQAEGLQHHRHRRSHPARRWRRSGRAGPRSCAKRSASARRTTCRARSS